MTDSPQNPTNGGTPPDVPLTCDACTIEERSNCIQCHRIFCPHYASEIDQAFCQLCLTDKVIGVTEQPLKDVEGISHAGKWILPSGSIYKTLPAAIASMTDVALEEYLRYMRDRVHAAEQTLQHLRISDSVAKMEKEQRRMLDDRRLRGIRLPTSANTGIKIDGGVAKVARTPEEKIKDVAATIKAMGVTREMLEALLAAAKAKQQKTQ